MAKATQYQQDFAAKMAAEEAEQSENLPALRVVPEDQDPFDSVGSMLDELRETGEVGELKVYGRPKQQPGQSTQRGNAFLMSCDASAYTLGELMTFIQDSWGEGVYTLKITSSGKYAGQRTISIGPAATKPGSQTVTPPIDTTKQLGEMFDKMLRQQTETMAAMLGSVLSKLDRPVIDPMTLQRDTIAMLGSMREIFSPPAQPTQFAVNPSSTFSQLKELLEIKDLLAGGGGGSDDSNQLMDMAKTFLPALLASASQSQSTPGPVTQSKPQTLLRGPTADQNVKPPSSKIQESPQMLAMIQGLNELVAAAKRGSSPELYAELVVDRFPLEQIKSFIASPDAVDRLALFQKDVILYRKWFDELRAHILQWIAEAEETTDDTSASPETSTDGNNVAVDGDTTR